MDREDGISKTPGDSYVVAKPWKSTLTEIDPRAVPEEPDMSLGPLEAGEPFQDLRILHAVKIGNPESADR